MGRYRDKRSGRMSENRLPELGENERIYLNVAYANRGFARACHCGFDADKKMWFTGAYNGLIGQLVDLYGVDGEHTSGDAMQLLQMALETPDREDLLEKLRSWYEERNADEGRPEEPGE